MGDLDLPMHSQTNYSVEPVNKYLIAIGVRDRVQLCGVSRQVIVNASTARLVTTGALHAGAASADIWAGPAGVWR